MHKHNNWAYYKFDRSTLDPSQRPFGISGMLRVRGHEPFLDWAVRSHFPYLDEIVAVYQECPPEEEHILRSWATRYPQRFRLFHYEPTVLFHPRISKTDLRHIDTTSHADTPPDSVHSIVNYCNWTLSKTRYRIVTKVDADHIAMSAEYRRITDYIRRHRLLRTAFFFSGLNIAPLSAEKLGFCRLKPYGGSGDHWFLPLSQKTIFEHDPRYERLHTEELGYKRRWVGFLYYHLKYMKPEFMKYVEPSDIWGFERLADAIHQGFMRRWSGWRGLIVRLAHRPLCLYHTIMATIAPHIPVSLLRHPLTNYCDAMLRQQQGRFAHSLQQMLSDSILPPLRKA